MLNRSKQIEKASWIGIIANFFLALIKITAGYLANSMAVIGDGIDSATDILTYFISLIASRIMSRPPNCKYPYGYNRAETVGTKALSFIIFFAGAQLFFSSLMQLWQTEERPLPGTLAIYVTMGSLVIKTVLAFYNINLGKKIQSPILIANGKNMRNDIFINLSVLIGILAARWFKMPLFDIITALAISIWIMRTAFFIFMETNKELMDGVDDTDLYYKIFDAVEAVEGANNPHRVRLRKHASKYVIALDIEVNGDLTINKGHNIAQEVERSIRRTIPETYDVMVHTEPLGNEEREEFGLSKEQMDNEQGRIPNS
ncbi:MAG: cation diffusion facilitator family transporter [Bacteroidales bacterium]